MIKKATKQHEYVGHLPKEQKGVVGTYSGKLIDVFHPKPELINIEDIAHALSNQCRFAGHTRRFYSVAEHCVNAVKMATPAHQLAALLHDASEAYLVDIPRPLKIAMPQYYKAEYVLMEVIAEKFGFQYPLAEEVQNIDNGLLEMEWQNLMADCTWITMSPADAEDQFLRQYEQIINK